MSVNPHESRPWLASYADDVPAEIEAPKQMTAG